MTLLALLYIVILIALTAGGAFYAANRQKQRERHLRRSEGAKAGWAKRRAGTNPTGPQA